MRTTSWRGRRRTAEGSPAIRDGGARLSSLQSHAAARASLLPLLGGERLMGFTPTYFLFSTKFPSKYTFVELLNTVSLDTVEGELLTST